MTRSETAPDRAPALAVRAVSRSFGPVQALRDVSFDVAQGEVVGLSGENGAGKSTLLNIISGTDRPDSGEIAVRGLPVTYRSYHDAARDGVYRVFQELALIPNIPVWENLFLGHEALFRRAGIILRHKAIRTAQAVFERMGHEWIDVRAPVQSYPFAIRQIIEILRAFTLAEVLGWTNPILLLDEPTAAVDSEEIEFLHGMIERVRRESAVVLVSHRLVELLEWSDRVVVMKDGAVVGGGHAERLTEDELHFQMVGRERDRSFYREVRQRRPEPERLLEVEQLGDTGAFRDVSLSVHRGEIVGIAGVLGSGKSELGEALFGSRATTSGSLRYRGALVKHVSIDAMTRRGVGYVPPERKEDGLLDTFSVAQNISLARLTSRGGPLLNLRDEAAEGRKYVDRLRIRTASPNASILTLSGGNQQKAVLARWLSRGVEMLILDNPTRGVDAGAKEEIYDLLRDLVDEGVGIVLISDDLLEVIGLSNRIIVMKSGEVTSHVDSPADAKPDEAALIARMV